jgi:hypothetical protein
MKKDKTLSTWFKKNGKFFARHRFTEPHFDAHTKSIGSLLLAWNDFHERLSTLFAQAMGVPQFARSFAIWHKTRNDAGKRQLLRSAITNLPESEMGVRIRRADGTLRGGRPQLVKEITWILEVADKLEGFRDDSAHTPLNYAYLGDVLSLADVMTTPNIFDPGEQAVTPHTGFANPRALRLLNSEQDLLAKHRYGRSRILILRDYVIAIEHAWSNPFVPWPDRPDLPDRKPNRRSKRSAPRRKRK